MCSFLVSITKMASGTRSRLEMPLRLRSSFSSSRLWCKASRLGILSKSPARCLPRRSTMRLTRPAPGAQLVNNLARQPLVHEGHAAGLGVVLDRTLGLLLGADEQDDAPVGHQIAHVGVTRLDAGQGLAQVNQIDAVAFAENETTHFGVPTTGLVPEVHTRVQQFLQSDKCHVLFLPFGYSIPAVHH